MKFIVPIEALNAVQKQFGVDQNGALAIIAGTVSEHQRRQHNREEFYRKQKRKDDKIEDIPQGPIERLDDDDENWSPTSYGYGRE